MRMNRWVLSSIAIILVVGVVAIFGILYTPETDELQHYQTKAANLKGSVSSLEIALEIKETLVSTLETSLARTEAQVLSLGGNVSSLELELVAAEVQISTLEAELLVMEAHVSILKAGLVALEVSLCE